MNKEMALKFALLCQESYKNKLKNIFDYDEVRFIEKDNIQAYVLYNDVEIVFCFRGTDFDEVKDIIADIDVFTLHSEFGVKIHEGFNKSVDKIWNKIYNLVKRHYGKKMYITGHSLGAAIATIMLYRLEKEFVIDSLYTYGSPRVGNGHFAKSIKTKHYRFVDHKDIVTKLPMAWLGYRHSGELVYIKNNRLKGHSLIDIIKDWFVRGGIQDHKIKNYIRALEKL